MTKQGKLPVLAADIGGTKILTVLFDAGGKMLAKDVRPTLASEGVGAVIERLCSAIGAMVKKSEKEYGGAGGICIACAGGVDTSRGVVVTPSPNLPGWVDIPLAEMVQKRFNTRTFIVNDASAAALGEHRYGAGRGVKNLVLFTLGTGIGGGIIIDSKLYLGACGGAGELGHMTVDADGPDCGCGNKGCLEVLASGRAIERDAVRRVGSGESSLLFKMVEGKVDSITAEDIGAAAREGDKVALEVISRAADYLGIGMVNAVNIFNPEMVIIGGGMAAMGDRLIGPGRRMVEERAFSISSRAVRIVTARLGNEAGVCGAAAFAAEQTDMRLHK